MPFDSIATQDDRDFQQDAATASRGLRIIDPSLSDYERSQVADSLRPDMMRLAQMTKMRGDLNQMDRESRGFLRTENDIAEKRLEFDTFQNELGGMENGDLQGNMEQYATMSRKYAGNPEIQRMLSDASSMESKLANVPKQVLESQKATDDLNDYNAYDEADRKKARLINDTQMKTMLATAEMGWKAAEEKQAVEGFADDAHISNLAGTFYKQYPKAGDALVGFRPRAEMLNLDTASIKAVENLGAIMANSMIYEQVEGVGMEAHKNMIDNLSSMAQKDFMSLSPAEQAATIGGLTRTDKNTKMQVTDVVGQKRANEALDAMSKYNEALGTRETLAKGMEQLVGNMPDPSDPKAVTEWKANIRQLSMKGNIINGGIQQKLKERALEIENRDRQLTVNDKISKINARVKGMTQADQRLEIQRELVDLKKRGFSDRQLLDAKDLIDNTDLMDEIHTSEDLLKFTNEFNEGLGKSRVGTDHFKED